MIDYPGTSLLAQTSQSLWLPARDSTTAGAEAVDTLFYGILAVATFFFVLIVALMVVFAVVYRRRPGKGPGDAPSYNLALETVWTVVPMVILVVIFYGGFVGYMDMQVPPREAYEINVVARQWQWQFTYPNGYSDPILHVPADQPVRLILRSEDVIHSLWIPDFRVKMDLVPGRYTKTWFRAAAPGEHELYCAEYCGTGHSDMTTQVIVHQPGQFEQWLEKAARGVEAMSPAERGRQLYVTTGCAGCHSTDGTAKTGPSFQGIWGQTHPFTNAPPAEVDENYVRESIVNPSAKVRQGYQDKMNSYQGQFTDQEIGYLIEFIQSLQ